MSFVFFPLMNRVVGSELRGLQVETQGKLQYFLKPFSLS